MDVPLTTTTIQSDFDHAALQRRITALVQGFSIETTPRDSAALASCRDILPRGTTVNIAFLPDSPLRDIVDTAARLRRDGFNPVPHLPARAFASERILRDLLGRLRARADVTGVLIIAGGHKFPLGPFADTMSILESGLLASHGITCIGVGGHPEGSPDIDAAALRRALKAKNDFAAKTGAEMYLITQCCLDAAPISGWAQSILQDGNKLPIDVGLPGATTVKSLLRYARLCGFGASRRILRHDKSKIMRLAAIAYPDRTMTAIARHVQSDPACQIRRLHFYPFGGLLRTAEWLQRVAAGEFSMTENLAGFTVSR